ncbi:hypothetical protein ACNAN0_02345 [Agrilactobacillus fermenti]|uniref:hypothetical protein n=1 Tax=Agrilactobacillus fermenti TaxID=2586909 RepID=UPI001E48238F|nr:hypothetical protein [Agrilactobacillus fermenti]MCD2257109.1 hypothetical protein [Agrilactobacillus fermenti]
MDVTVALGDEDNEQEVLINAIADRLAKKMTPIIEKIIEEKLTRERAMTQREVAEQILHCDPSTITDYYLEQPGFPFFAKGTKKMFWPAAVREWINNNQQSLI